MKKITFVMLLLGTGMLYAQTPGLAEAPIVEKTWDINANYVPIGDALNDNSIQALDFDTKLRSKNMAIPVNNNEYFDIKFSLAKINNNNDNKLLRYNALKDEFELMNNNSISILEKTVGQEVFFENGAIYKILPYEDGKEIKYSYFQVLSKPLNGNVFVKKNEIILTESVSSSAYDNVEAKSSFRHTKNQKPYFWKDNKLYTLPKNNKKLSELLGVNVDELIKSNNLNIKNEADLVKLINLANK